MSDLHPDSERILNKQRTSHYGRAFSRSDGNYDKYAAALGLPDGDADPLDFDYAYADGWEAAKHGDATEYYRRLAEWQRFSDGYHSQRALAQRNSRRS